MPRWDIREKRKDSLAGAIKLSGNVPQKGGGPYQRELNYRGEESRAEWSEVDSSAQWYLNRRKQNI